MKSLQPDRIGYYGEFGGRFVTEVLVQPLVELQRAATKALADPEFWNAYTALLRDFVGRPSPLLEAFGAFGPRSAQVLFKREDLNHTGSHKINNALGQGLLAQRLRKKRIIAETGAGQHGVATATVGARLGLPVEVYMGARDIERQSANVAAMRALGATVRPVDDGTQTLKDATSAALRDWAATCTDTYYLVGSVVGPHPYPAIVRKFQEIIGAEARETTLGRYGRLPSDVVACVGGGSNAIGIFSAFVNDAAVRLWGVEAAGSGIASADTAATLSAGSRGFLHGTHSYVLQDDDGQIRETHSIAAGLDYPGVGPEHAHLRHMGRVRYACVTDEEARAAYRRCAELEGILPALETAHALAFTEQLVAGAATGDLILVCFSGRGEKDLSRA
ncbi:MAG TPA: tryptophan synthase subunit beta [Candidatus Tumulicola sp.]